MEAQLETYNGQFIFYLIGGIVLFFCLEAIRFFLPHLIPNRKVEAFISRYFPVIELLFLFSFIIWIIPPLLATNVVIGRGVILLATIILLFVSWFALKDIVAGMIFKSGRDIRKGKDIKVFPYKGVIERLGIRNLVIKTEDDTSVYLPYGKILQREIEIHSHQKNLHKLQFTIQVQADSSGLKGDLTRQIHDFIMLMPWISAEEAPQVKVLKTEGQHIHVQIGVFALDNDYFQMIEKKIREEFES